MLARSLYTRWLVRSLTLLWLLLPATGWTQGKGGKLGDFSFPSAGPAGAFEGEKVTFEATYELHQHDRSGRLQVKAKLAETWHMYSTSQPDGGPLPTSISVASTEVEVTGPFTPNVRPDISEVEVWEGIPIEEHHGTVIWTAPIRRVKEFEPDAVVLDVKVDGQVCTTAGACVPINERFEAKFAGYYGSDPKQETLRVKNTQAEWSAELIPGSVTPGETAILKVTAQTDPRYHIYPFVPGDTETAFRTLIVAKTKSGLLFGEPRTSAGIAVDNRLGEPIRYHNEPVTWSIPVAVPSTAVEGEYPIELLIGFMTCDENSCSPQSGLSVAGNLQVASAMGLGAQPLALGSVPFSEVASVPTLASWIDQTVESPVLASAAEKSSRSPAPAASLELWMVFAALGGGFILNFMPCVLPVIGLKVMSFVNQAGNSHRHVVGLNLAFVGGILAVLMSLAVVTVLAKWAWGSAFGWGEQFTVLEFKVALAVLVFAMALSFLGVWEIPIPGFATSSKSGELMEKEGPWGAFLKGVLTTVLATPCSGPLLGSLFGLSLSLTAISVLLLYFIVGLGMSLPYLALCVYPGFIKLLPKPGAWMETLKQVLAFPLLLTVVFFVASIESDYRIATLTLLIVVWFACWLIGRVPAYAERNRIRAAYVTGFATIAAGAFLSFLLLGPIKSDLPWEPYNEAQLAKYRQAGKTVMIDFTANWCVNCQINMKFAIDKQGVAQVVNENDVIPMVADWTGRSDQIREKLDELESNSIPLLVIYPPDPTAEPILLRDLVTESQVIEALRQAGPSQPASRLASRTID